MSLVVSDTHGNKEKIRYFLEYKPEEEHIFAGDIMDSFIASDEDIVKSFKMLVDSECKLIWGNHDLHYLLRAPFQCTGFRGRDVFGHYIESFKSMFRASYVRDGFIITHAGVHKAFSHYRKRDIHDLNDYFNNEMTDFLNKIEPGNDFFPIFNIGYARGGRSDFGGIFWADYRREKLDFRFDQVFGHSCGKEPVLIKNKNKLHVCIDSPKWQLFNTKTRQIEDFFPEDQILNREYMERHF